MHKPPGPGKAWNFAHVPAANQPPRLIIQPCCLPEYSTISLPFPTNGIPVGGAPVGFGKAFVADGFRDGDFLGL